MAESKKPPRQTARARSSYPRGQRPSDASKAVDPAARITACEAELAKATADIIGLRLSVQAIHAELDDLRAGIASGLSRLRKLPPPLRASSHEIISVDDREVTLESVRPRKPR
jgi:hypothetical protein